VSVLRELRQHVRGARVVPVRRVNPSRCTATFGCSGHETAAAGAAARAIATALGLLVAMAPAAAGPGAANAGGVRWDAQGRFVRSLSIAPGAMTELCGRLARGQAVVWRFEADAPIDFNLHHHQGDQVIYSARLWSVEQAGERFMSGRAQVYCWMWQNPLPSVTRLKVTMERAAR